MTCLPAEQDLRVPNHISADDPTATSADLAGWLSTHVFRRYDAFRSWEYIHEAAEVFGACGRRDGYGFLAACHAGAAGWEDAAHRLDYSGFARWKRCGHLF